MGLEPLRLYLLGLSLVHMRKGGVVNMAAGKELELIFGLIIIILIVSAVLQEIQSTFTSVLLFIVVLAIIFRTFFGR